MNGGRIGNLLTSMGKLLKNSEAKDAAVALLLFLSFGEMLILAAMDKPAGATIAGGAFVVLFIFQHFPDLESFKALGVEAKLRERLNQADDLLKKIRKTAILSAGQQFFFMAWMNRLGGASKATRKAIIEETEKELLDIGFSASEIRDIKTPLVAAASADIFSKIYRILTRRTNEYSSHLHKEREKVFGREPINQQSDKYAVYMDLSDKIRRAHIKDDYFTRIMRSSDPVETTSEILSQFLEIEWLSLDEKRRLSSTIDDVIALCRAIKESGNYTDEAIEFEESIDFDGNPLYEKIFPDRII